MSEITASSKKTLKHGVPRLAPSAEQMADSISGSSRFNQLAFCIPPRFLSCRASKPLSTGCGSKPMGSQFGGEFITHFRTYSSGWIESDVHWGLTDLDFDPSRAFQQSRNPAPREVDPRARHLRKKPDDQYHQTPLNLWLKNRNSKMEPWQVTPICQTPADA